MRVWVERLLYHINGRPTAFFGAKTTFDTLIIINDDSAIGRTAATIQIIPTGSAATPAIATGAEAGIDGADGAGESGGDETYVKRGFKDTLEFFAGMVARTPGGCELFTLTNTVQFDDYLKYWDNNAG